MKDSTSALPKRTTLQHEGMLASVCFHEGKLARVSFPYSTRTSPFPKKGLHSLGNLKHARFNSIVKQNKRTSPLSTLTFHHEGMFKKSVLPTTTLHHEGRLTHASFPYSTSTSVLPKTTLHLERNVTYASFPSIVKESTRTSSFPTTMLHCKGKHKCIVKNDYTPS